MNELDAIQRKIWARIDDEAKKLGIEFSIGEAYSLGGVIKEVLHPEATAWRDKALKEARIDELKRNAHYAQPRQTDPLTLCGVSMTADAVEDRIKELSK